MTKEEMLSYCAIETDSWSNSYGMDFFDGKSTTVLKSMDEYAKQECIEFLKYYQHSKFIGIAEYNYNDEIYNAYLQHKQQ